MLDLKCELLGDIDADLEKPIDVGSTPHGVRMLYNVKGGPLRVPKLAVRCFQQKRTG